MRNLICSSQVVYENIFYTKQIVLLQHGNNTCVRRARIVIGPRRMWLSREMKIVAPRPGVAKLDANTCACVFETTLLDRTVRRVRTG